MAFTHLEAPTLFCQRTDADEAERAGGLLKCGEWAFQ
jgi:hypothetical protein